jgi:hypothetical protein
MRFLLASHASLPNHQPQLILVMVSFDQCFFTAGLHVLGGSFCFATLFLARDCNCRETQSFLVELETCFYVNEDERSPGFPPHSASVLDVMLHKPPPLVHRSAGIENVTGIPRFRDVHQRGATCFRICGSPSH